MMSKMGKAAADPPDHAGIVGVAVAAKLIKVTPERIRQLVKDGYIAKAGYDRYAIVAVVQGYIRSLQEQLDRRHHITSASRVQDERAAEIAMRRAKIERQTITRAEAAETIDGVVEIMREVISELPERLSGDPTTRAAHRIEIEASITRIDQRAAAEKLILATGRLGKKHLVSNDHE